MPPQPDRSLVFVLDRSGSMETCRDDTIGGFNSFVNSQKELGGTMTLVQFDHEYQVTYSNKDLKEVPPLTHDTFCPRGSTALHDAVGRAIKEASDLPTKPIVIILTDGHENASREYTKPQIKMLIDILTKQGWQFLYLGANQDAFDEAGQLGIAAGCTMNFDVRKTPEAFRSLDAALSSAASCQSQRVDLGPKSV